MSKTNMMLLGALLLVIFVMFWYMYYLVLFVDMTINNKIIYQRKPH